MESIGDRVRLRRKELGLNQKDLAAAVGVSAPAISQLEKGDSKTPSSENLLKLAQALQCTPKWIQSGVISIPDVDPVDMLPGFVDLPIYDAQFSAGHGVEGDDNADLETFPVPEKLLELMRVNPAHAMIVKVKGDSMEPTLNDGESIVIDAGSTHPVSDQVYAFKFEGELKVKRFIKEYSGLWRIKSDNEYNPAYQDQSIDLSNVSGIEIIGRVAGLVGRAF